MKENIKMYMEKSTEVAVFTKEGDKLIGIIVSEELVKFNLGPVALPSYGQQGIYLKRKKHLSFLGEDNIESIRPGKFGEKEIDRNK